MTVILHSIWLFTLIRTPSIISMVLTISISVFTQELICFPADDRLGITVHDKIRSMD